jgi:hypothetical protein
MGQCVYCGESVGFLKKAHKECKQRHERGKSEIVTLLGKAGSEGGDLKRLESSIQQLASSNHIDASTMNSLVVSGWEMAVDKAFG